MVELTVEDREVLVSMVVSVNVQGSAVIKSALKSMTVDGTFEVIAVSARAVVTVSVPAGEVTYNVVPSATAA